MHVLHARDTYLASNIQSAAPERLHLMLVEGAIRFCRQGLAQWDAGDDDEASISLFRALDILVEMISALRPEHNESVARQVAALYLYMLDRLTSAHRQRDPYRVTEVLDLLEIERSTWVELCQRSADAPSQPAISPPAAHFSMPAAYERADFTA